MLRRRKTRYASAEMHEGKRRIPCPIADEIDQWQEESDCARDPKSGGRHEAATAFFVVSKQQAGAEHARRDAEERKDHAGHQVIASVIASGAWQLPYARCNKEERWQAEDQRCHADRDLPLPRNLTRIVRH